MSEAVRDGLECRINARLCDIQRPRQTALPACIIVFRSKIFCGATAVFETIGRRTKGVEEDRGAISLFGSRVPVSVFHPVNSSRGRKKKFDRR
jgi:hypothetical protein